MTMGIAVFLSYTMSTALPLNDWQMIEYGFLMSALLFYIDLIKELFSKVSWSVTNTYTTICG